MEYMKEENKIWVGGDGIIHVEMIEMVNEKEVLERRSKRNYENGFTLSKNFNC
jgi:hypothetical protein